MKRAGKFFRLSRTERRLLLESLIIVGAIRLALWLLPFKTLRRLCARWGRVTVGSEDGLSDAKKVAWAVKAASRYVPRSTCLTQALAAMVLLGRNGQPSRLRIGVAKNTEGKLEAHAWVESHGDIIIGRLAGLSRYAVLPPPKEEVS